MKSLFKLFFTPYIKVWFIYLLLHIGFFSVQALQPHLNDAFANALLSLRSMFLALGWLIFLVSTFSYNISWMINTHYSRAKLIVYYFLEQTVKIILVFFPYLVIVIAGGLKRKKSNIDFSVIVNNISDAEVNTSAVKNMFEFASEFAWKLPLLLVAFLLIFYTIPLIVSQSRTANTINGVAWGNRKEKIKRGFIVAISILIGFQTIEVMSKSEFISEFIFFIVFLMVSVYFIVNRFNLLRLKTHAVLLAVFFFMGMTYYSLMYMHQKSVIISTKSSPEVRLDYYLGLEILSPKVSEGLLEKFLVLIEDKDDLKKFLSINPNFNFNFLLDHIFNKNNKHTISHQWALLEHVNTRESFSEDKSKDLIGRIIQFNKNKKEIESLFYLNKFIKKYKISDTNYIDSIYQQKTKFTDFVALKYTRHHLPKEQQSKFLMKYKGYLKPSRVVSVFGKDKVPKEYMDYINRK